MNKALLIIDIQNFYFGEGGTEGGIEASLKAQKLLYHFREHGLPVFHIEHYPDLSNASDEKKSLQKYMKMLNQLRVKQSLRRKNLEALMAQIY